MALYLDIDLDYFVTPVIKESISNCRPTNGANFRLTEPTTLFNILKQKGVLMGNKRFFFTNHMQSHLRWWINREPDNLVIHIDAHSDLYGHNQPDLSQLKKLGCQNYLWHSLREGLIAEIYWVFPEGVVDINDPGLLKRMFTPTQVGNHYISNNILHVELLCTLPGGQTKTVPYHLMRAEDLPSFGQTAEMITVASSPEFIPRQADELILEVGQLLELNSSLIANLMEQHRSMKSLG